MAGTLLSATTKPDGPLRCASHHHQGVDRLGDGLHVVGRSPDGLVEAIARDGADFNRPSPWMLGVQWHPEETAADDPTQQRLFDGLVVNASFKGQQPRPERLRRSRTYHVADPDPAWPSAFEAEAAKIRGALPAGLIARVDHVGSTSVPGLAAKPVIDIQLSLTSLVPVGAYAEPLISLGYQHAVDPYNDDHEFFSHKVGEEYEGVNLHVTVAGSAWERRHLAFRDRLRERQDDRAAYERLKRDLAAAHPQDIVSYTDGKTRFIESLVERATQD